MRVLRTLVTLSFYLSSWACRRMHVLRTCHPEPVEGCACRTLVIL